jgi:hypothetical protein
MQAKSQGVVSARRRLIRGTFAAPAVVALHSGSAFANVSSLRCVNFQVDHPVYPPFQTTPSDTYIRVQLWSVRKSSGSTPENQIRWFIKGSDVDAIRLNKASINNFFMASSNEWWEFDKSTYQLKGSKLSTPQPAYSASDIGVINHDGGWVAVRINASTTDVSIVGVVESGKTGGSAVLYSCWSSFRLGV